MGVLPAPLGGGKMARLSSGAMLTTARLVDPVGGRASYGLFRVDTGDDIVIANPHVIQSAGATATGQMQVEGIDGRPLAVPIYTLDVDLGPMGYVQGVTVLGLDISALGYQGLIGDNLLDHGVLVRDGPGKAWSFTAAGYRPSPPPYPIALAIAGVGIAAVAAAALWPQRPR